jgi:uncharacterized LabA/DUF88 family protein
MFKAKTDQIEKMAIEYKTVIDQLQLLFAGNVSIYIDYANVRPWATKLGWNIELKRLKQFLSSFDNVSLIKIYDGILKGDKLSEERSERMAKIFKDGYKTKPVKVMKQSVEFTSIKPTATDLLEHFIRKCLIKKYEVETIEYLNLKFKEMNQKGIHYIEDLKCNFDVEIGRDMLIDYEINSIDTFILWSGDSDFHDPIKQLLADGKKVILFATARRVASELNDLQKSGLFIFDIQKIRNFICWKKQVQ